MNMDEITPAPSAGESEPANVDTGIAQAFGAPKPDALGPYDNHVKLLQFYESFKIECLEERTVYEREWRRKLTMLSGRMWIYFDVKRSQWQDKRLAKWMPRPVTNFIAEAVDVFRSVFGQVSLSVSARPLGQSPENIATAEIADEIEPCLVQEHDFKSKQREADFWLSTLHSVFLHTWWDKRAEVNGVVTIQHERCGACRALVDPKDLLPIPACPACGGTSFSRAVDADGQPEGPKTVVGKGATDVLCPLEVLVPPAIPLFADVPGLIRQRWRTKRWWTANYPDFAKTLTFAAAPTDKSLQHVRDLATQTDISTGNSSTMIGGGGESGAGTEGLAEYELWYKPCHDYPDGLFMRVAGESSPKIVVDPNEGTPGPLPYVTKDGVRLWPWVYERFQSVGGRFWGKGPIDLILDKNIQVNQLDSLISLIIQRMANPIWLKPKGAEVQSFTGEPGLVVEWNPLAAGGNAKPERIPGENVPPSLMAIRKQLVDDIERLAATSDIMKGQKPAGVEAFSALQLLVERSQSRFGGALAERGEGYCAWYTLALELERLYGPEKRTLSILGPNRNWSFRHFKNAQLHGAVEIIVEDGTQVPKTNLGKRAAVEQANNLGMIDAKNPETKYSLLKDFGLANLMPSLDANVKSALQEQDAFEQWVDAGEQGVCPMGVKKWHDDAIHLSEHRKWLNGDRVRQMISQHPELTDILDQHLDAHEQQQVLKEMPPSQRAQAMAAAAGGNIPGQAPGQQPAPAGGAGGAQAMSSSNRESDAATAPPPAQAPAAA